MKTALCLLVLLCSASARVGETYEQLRKRFDVEPHRGPAKTVGGLEVLTFKKGEIEIMVIIVEGTASEETYRQITKEQAELIRDKQADAWKPSDGLPGREMLGNAGKWKSPNGLYATIDDHKQLRGPAVDRRFELRLTDGRAYAIDAAAWKEQQKVKQESVLKEVETF